MRTSGKLVWVALATVFCCSLFAQSKPGEYERARELVGRVQHDLKRAEDFSRPEGKQRERYQNAQQHLSEFDSKLSRNKFDKGKLDEAIDDVKNVLENNTLSPEGRDELKRDMDDLRQMREARGRM